jgi:hypothetical protein
MPSHDRGKRPRIADLSALLEALTEAGIDFIVVGGLAAVAQGAPITTMDVGIVHRQSSDNINKLFTSLKTVDAIYRRPDDKILEPDIRDLSGRGHALFATRYGPLDVLAVIEEGRGYEELLPDTVEIEFRWRKVRILSLQTLVELKQGSRDSKDRQRLVVLQETLRQLRKDKSEDV